MIHLFINALSATAGGGLTYVRNVLPCLAARDSVRTTVLVAESVRKEIPESGRLAILRETIPPGSAARFCYEQRSLPGLIRRAAADVLLSTGNFALFRAPVPQILLSRNSLYTSTDFLRDLRQRGDYRLWIDTKIKGAVAKWSVASADCTVAPSQTFAAELQRWTGKGVVSIHHGFNRQTFFAQGPALAPDVEAKLSATNDAIRILFVSHYNYYRNFETLIRAIAILRKQLHPRPVRLILTCTLAANRNPGSYETGAAAELVNHLNLRDEVVELGSIPYASLHELYRRCHLYATPAYAETFAHPLVEAMASGLTIVASDIAVHREICGPAALYFPRFSSQMLAERIIETVDSAELNSQMRARAILRSRDFSWDKHVDQLLSLANRISKLSLPVGDAAATNKD
jgi:glycosyltransferase involved in cell wall biosynthesis